jgi:hypothetical protein
MQTVTLTGTRSSWPDWVEFLRRRRLEALTSWVLEAFGPLTVLGAQVLHVGSPLLRPALSTLQVESLASMLEDPAETRAFAAYLREEISP